MASFIIEKENLLIRLKKAECEITLLRQQNSKLVQNDSANQSYILELESKLAKREVSENRLKELERQIDSFRDKNQRQKEQLKAYASSKKIMKRVNKIDKIINYEKSKIN